MCCFTNLHLVNISYNWTFSINSRLQRSLFSVRYFSDSLMCFVFPGFVLRELCLTELCNKDWELLLG